MWKAVLALCIWGCWASTAVAQSFPATGFSSELPLTSTRPADTRPAATQPSTRVNLDGVCPMDLRGTPLRQALAELADRLGARYILDATISAAVLDEPVRMMASHLTGQQAFRWLARIGGVSAVLVEGVFLVAPEERLPAMWRATGSGSPSRRASEQARWAKVNSRRADIEWVDTPLTGAAEDTSRLFGVDLLYHPALLVRPRLLYLKETDVSLDRLREVLSRQLNARTDLYDGVLWVHPQGETVLWLPPADRAPETESAEPDVFRAPASEMWVVVDGSTKSWDEFAAVLSAAAGIPCGVDSEAGTSYPGIQAAGSVGEVLDGLRMLGLLAWNVAPEGPDSGPRINIKLREKG